MSTEILAIEKISIYKLSIPLKKPFIISLGPIYTADNIIVTLETKTGLTGFGECSPFMTINGENQQTCFEVGQYLAKGLKDKNALDFEGNHRIMEKIIYSNSSIKSAFDIAMYDIASQHAGLPLYKFIGGKKNKKIVTDYTISIGDASHMADDALKIKEQGFKIIKVKLGGEGDEDVERIHAIRKAVGKKIKLRIDANQGWDVATAKKTLKALGKFDIQYCEEPIARWNYMQLRSVKKASPIKIMADESCCDENDAKRLIGLKACDMFNLKLGKSSGIFRALKIIDLAAADNMKMQVGGFMESRIGMTANAHLSLSNKNIQYFDFDTPLMFTEDPVSGGIVYRENGVIDLPDSAGLGASIDAEKLAGLPSYVC